MLNTKSILLTLVISLTLPSSQIACSSIKITKKDVMTDQEYNNMMVFSDAGFTLAAVSLGARMFNAHTNSKYKSTIKVAANASDVALVGTLAFAAIKDLRSKKGMKNTQAVAGSAVVSAGAIILPFYMGLRVGLMVGGSINWQVFFD